MEWTLPHAGRKVTRLLSSEGQAGPDRMKKALKRARQFSLSSTGSKDTHKSP